jgi:hypothetical protein
MADKMADKGVRMHKVTLKTDRKQPQITGHKRKIDITMNHTRKKACSSPSGPQLNGGLGLGPNLLLGIGVVVEEEEMERMDFMDEMELEADSDQSHSTDRDSEESENTEDSNESDSNMGLGDLATWRTDEATWIPMPGIQLAMADAFRNMVGNKEGQTVFKAEEEGREEIQRQAEEGFRDFVEVYWRIVMILISINVQKALKPEIQKIRKRIEGDETGERHQLQREMVGWWDCRILLYSEGVERIKQELQELKAIRKVEKTAEAGNIKYIWGMLKTARERVNIEESERENRVRMGEEEERMREIQGESRETARVALQTWLMARGERRERAREALQAWQKREATKRERDEVPTKVRQEIETLVEARSSKVRKRNTQRDTVVLTGQHVYWKEREREPDRETEWDDTGIG